jgi:hypothetical protein
MTQRLNVVTLWVSATLWLAACGDVQVSLESAQTLAGNDQSATLAAELQTQIVGPATALRAAVAEPSLTPLTAAPSDTPLPVASPTLGVETSPPTSAPRATPAPPSATQVAPPPQKTSTVISSPRVAAFTVGPNPVERGSTLTVAWDVPGAAEVSIWPMTYDRKTGRWYRVPAGQSFQLLPSPAATGSASGQQTLSIKIDSRYPIQFELQALGADGTTVVATSEVIRFKCYPNLVSGTGFCPYPPETVPAVYQAFEYGHLIWRGDLAQTYVLSNNQSYYIPWSLIPNSAESASVTTPPVGLYPPGEHFAGLWSSHTLQAGVIGSSPPESRALTVGEILGWATGPEQVYSMPMQKDLENTSSGIHQDSIKLTLPDGRFAVLILYNGYYGTHGPGWGMLNPPWGR